MTRSLDEQLNRIERVQVSLATNQITERIGDRFSRPQPPPTFEIQLGNLPPAVRSVAESLATTGHGISKALRSTISFS
jgi:hypothetical protein